MKTKLLSALFPAILLCLCTITTKAQSPRLQLLEYFDNANIPPFGAVANANVDSLITNYSDKITCIKYHVAWPGVDPMNGHNPTQAQTRVNYYFITADPHAIQDGAVKADSTFSAQPSGFTSAMIKKRNLVTSPFTVKVSHSFNTAKDTIFTHTVVTKTGTVTATGPLVAHVAVIEKIVHFTTAPGQSGDKNFQNVMKQMLPTDSGTVLSAMNIGDSLVIDLPWKLANVYDENQLCVVSFVQGKDSLNREVYQAGQSFPIPVALDAGTQAIVNSTFHCDSIDQKVVLKNYGLNTLTSCDIKCKVDAGAPSTMSWTGSLATNATTTVTIHLTGLTGKHNLTIYSANPNGSADLGHFNDTTLASITLASASTASPLAEGFQGTFLPANWATVNPDNALTWAKDSLVGGFGFTTRSTRLDFYQMADTNQYDDLYPPQMDLSAVTGKYYLHFDVAYANYLPPATDSLKYFDTLQVKISKDCGATWTTVYSKSESVLQTAPPVAALFVPTASQWRHEIINLASFLGQSEVQIQFHGMSGWGNDVYLDNILTNNSTLNAGTSTLSLSTLPCDSVDLTAVLKNNGLDTITTCDVKYKVNSGTPVTIPWTGTLLPGNSVNVPIHLTGLTGTTIVKIYSSNPNGGLDPINGDDTTSVTIKVAPAPVAAPLVQGFQGTFPPAKWSIINPDKGITWSKGLAGGFGWSTWSAELACFNSSAGQADDLYIPTLDLSLDTGKMYCLFNVAYARKNITSIDTLKLQVTKDCGITWTTLYSKWDTALITTPTFYASAFTPPTGKWRSEIVDISSVVGQSEVMLRFHGISGNGNNIYVDDINIGHSTTGVISNEPADEIGLFPNPSTGIVNLSVQLARTQNLKISVSNMLGETFIRNEYGQTTGGNYLLNLTSCPSGIYFVKIITDGQTETKKIIINK